MCYEVGKTLGVLQWSQLEGGPSGCGAVCLPAVCRSVRSSNAGSVCSPQLQHPLQPGSLLALWGSSTHWALGDVLSDLTFFRSFLVEVVVYAFPWRLLPTHKAIKLLHF